MTFCVFHRVILIEEVEVLLEGVDLEVRVLVLWIKSKGEERMERG